MVAYKEWGFQLYPGVAFEDLASRTEKLSGKARTRDLMQELRDTERDRVIEAKYGRAAVDDVRAQEAAKLLVKEEGQAEEREEEKLAGSRYMEVDGEEEEEGGWVLSSSTDVGKEGGGKDGGQSGAVLSEQVRQRMEVNRRLALERLRLKKEEAAAAAAAEGVLGNKDQAMGAGNVSMPAPDNGGEVEDLMDVDGGGERGADDDFEDDEAALADMEADQVAAVTAKPTTAGAETPQANTAAVPAAASGEATMHHPADAAQDVVAEGTTSAESTTRKGDAVDDEEGSLGDSGTVETAVADDLAPDPASVASGETAKKPMDDAPTVSDADNSALGRPPSGLVSGEKDCANDEGDASRGGTGNSTTADTSAAGSAMVGDEPVADGAGATEPTAAKGNGREESFSSPTKCKAAGGLPLSPLGNMFASTDVPAEGGSIAVRAPLGGLFSDENL